MDQAPENWNRQTHGRTTPSMNPCFLLLMVAWWFYNANMVPVLKSTSLWRGIIIHHLQICLNLWADLFQGETSFVPLPQVTQGYFCVRLNLPPVSELHFQVAFWSVMGACDSKKAGSLGLAKPSWSDFKWLPRTKSHTHTSYTPGHRNIYPSLTVFVHAGIQFLQPPTSLCCCS